MDEPLKDKDEIMEYSGLGKSALREAIDKFNFPCFYSGGKLKSCKRAVDEWFYQMSVTGLSMGGEAEDTEERKD